ncbi:hypothetical protein QBZ16_001177 [Prototheca wickerhamii]|uniref:Uncharacterized protein n=1 Tax=Prototheca wickerhamii TaxID=3111 RepID=A0AAD9MJA7_PROWI|nr:hypothetical protein QBZ16_001177 [Prototheca wickerhamii]
MADTGRSSSTSRSMAFRRRFEHAFCSATSAVTALRFARLAPGLLAWGDERGAVSVAATPWKGGTPRVILVLRGGHGASVTDLDWSANNAVLASCAADGTACVWSVADGRRLRRFVCRAGAVGSRAGCSLTVADEEDREAGQQVANLVLLGTLGDGVLLANLGSGQCVARCLPGERVAALETAGASLLVARADASELVALSLDAPQAGTQGQPLRTLQRLRAPGVPRGAGAVRLEILAGDAVWPWVRLEGGDLDRVAALTTADGTLSLFHVPADPPRSRPVFALSASAARVTAIAPAPLAQFALSRDGMRGLAPQAAIGGRADALVTLVAPPAPVPGTVQRLGDEDERGGRVWTLRGQASSVPCVDWSFRGLFLASADATGNVLLWCKHELSA